jgi:hypothetical protein
MVWAVILPSVFNEFAPRGEFAGYDEKLDIAYRELSPRDENGETFRSVNTYKYWVSRKFTMQWVDVAPARHPVDWVKDWEWPTKLVLEKEYKRKASMMQMANGLLCVSDELRLLIESLDPDTHLFRPLDLVLWNGRPSPEQFFTMIVRNWREAIRPAESDEGVLYRSSLSGLYTVPIQGVKEFRSVAVAEEAARGCHVWKDRTILSVDFYISDKLQSAAKETGIRLPPHFKLKSV